MRTSPQKINGEFSCVAIATTEKAQRRDQGRVSQHRIRSLFFFEDGYDFCNCGVFFFFWFPAWVAARASENAKSPKFWAPAQVNYKQGASGHVEVGSSRHSNGRFMAMGGLLAK